MPRPRRSIEIMDTTLRDGEQTPDVAYTPAEKLQLGRILLEDVGVNRIEIAQARVSEGEREAAQKLARWARSERLLSRIEIMGYCDHKLSADWIVGVGARVMNLLIKGSRKHCETQLRATPEQHRAQVAQTIRYARGRKLRVNVYLEDWSNGVRDSFDYVFAMTDLLQGLGVERIFLADTLGVLSPETAARYTQLMLDSWPDARFEFHAHNDYGLATANCLAAVEAGAHGVHTSVNGMGERAATRASPRSWRRCTTTAPCVRRRRVASQCGVAPGRDLQRQGRAANAPIVGRDVFTQTGGIHADGDAKGDLYASLLAPARFGQQRRYALGSSRARPRSSTTCARSGIELAPQDRELVLARISRARRQEAHGRRGPALHHRRRAEVAGQAAGLRRRLEGRRRNGRTPRAEVELTSQARPRARPSHSGDGGYDAFMNALRKAARKLNRGGRAGRLPRADPPGRPQHAALVETVITWRSEDAPDGTSRRSAWTPTSSRPR